MSGVIAVHVGAGYHGSSLRTAYKDACKKACIAAIEKLKTGMNAVEAVAEAVCVLENCPLTNAGIGSNLTFNGVVECDAGIMDGKNLNFGSVGALKNIKNPVKVAQKILEEQACGLLPGGRIPPCTLVGSGATDWALEKGFKFFDNQFLSTKASETAFSKNLSLVQNTLSTVQENSNPMLENGIDDNDLFDTVGAVCVDCFGNVASAVSSGGLLLKYSGRIGQAAVFGSGCWAEQSIEDEKPSIAICVTGIGEYLIKTMFARECHHTLYNDPYSVSAVPDFFKNKFINNSCLKNVDLKLAGVLILKCFSQEDFCELSWAHNTKTMILGYMSTDSKKPVTIFSSQPESATIGESVMFAEKCIKLKHTS
ncbi:threonine aspartase 1 [Parasteatoda tepidariorum]|uniref:threonine aspartase 1 n=1 Tax=Parasteatoda tepidariorum TaxID=114398 RepID=UPI00077FC49F|nr:threonine aspartase 1 [Parasteatoda tepidariorum]